MRGRIHVITQVSVCRRVVQGILVLPTDTVAVSVKIGNVHQRAAVVLLCVVTPDCQVYLFDVKCCPAMIVKGELWRLLESNSLTKVMHDCRLSSDVLMKQFKIRLRSVFDTQAAFSVLMVQNGLPARIIALDTLYDKFGDMDRKFPRLTRSLECDAMFWNQRPLSSEMVRLAADSTLPLVCQIQNNINKQLKSPSHELVSDLSFAYINGHYPSSRQTSDSRRSSYQDQELLASVRGLRKADDKTDVSCHQTIVKLDSDHHKLLAGSLSQANVAPLAV